MTTVLMLRLAALLALPYLAHGINWNGNNWALACDFPGNDLSNVKTSSSNCGGACAATSGCTHFAWTSWNGGTCWMKYGTVTQQNAVPTSDQTTVCGITTSGINWNGNNWANGCDFPGNDLSNVQIASSACGGRCASTSGCTHFAWTTYNGGTCWMKSGTVTQQNAVATSDQTMVCGITGSGGGSGGQTQPGTTTRYWDCCKPSCAWSGKAPVTNPVQTCSNNGVSAITNVNAASGCGGGTAYTCNSQQPYAVNSQLAYGFAAANIPGSNENGWCCACYKLDFTSTALAGKSMIVQVTNTGSDLGSGHFDLQLPGGGVGLFDGCTSQWGLPTSVWGQTYGGVSSRSDCSSLPAAIQPGCYFRFDWFMGADNPTMNFAEVACPVELQAKSNCARTA